MFEKKKVVLLYANNLAVYSLFTLDSSFPLGETFSSCATVTDTVVYSYRRVVWLVENAMINHHAVSIYIPLCNCIVEIEYLNFKSWFVECTFTILMGYPL